MAFLMSYSGFVRDRLTSFDSISRFSLLSDTLVKVSSSHIIVD